MYEHKIAKDLKKVQADTDQLKRMCTYSLSDAIREGSQVTEQAYGWGGKGKACALSAAALAAEARDIL